MALTDDEFAQAKARLLSGALVRDAAPPPVAPPPAPSRLPAAQPSQPYRSAPSASAREEWLVRVNGGAAVAGGLLTLFAFLAMPIATVPILGSITGSGLAEQASQPGIGLLGMVVAGAAGVLMLVALGPVVAERRRSQGSR
jgi:hypothetical protein